MTMQTIVSLMLLFPLAGAFLVGVARLGAKRRLVEWIACGSVAASCLLALTAMVRAGDRPVAFTLWTWFTVGRLDAALAIRYDHLAAVMALVVTLVAALVHLYSAAYMRQEEGYGRYFCYLNLFVFAMLVIIVADNLLFLFLGWEGVGFCSYALIGHWFRDPANGTAARKAFLVTRIGDVAFLVAIGVLFAAFGTVNIARLNTHAAELSAAAAAGIGLLFLLAAMGKSAQLPLSVWLPDAMAGPTPVSALIHAATMVTAGVYLLTRLLPLVSLSAPVMIVIASIGAVTALYAGFCALGQRDIKRVAAYSTVSQLGYMFLGIGAGDSSGAMFHLLTHAFFKSLLFLAAGCVILALDGEHDIMRMGRSLRQRSTALFVLFTASIISLAGLPPTAGFFSKGQILAAAYAAAPKISFFPYMIGIIAAFFTSMYSFRLLFLCFTGRPTAGETPAGGDVPPLMLLVLWPLALLAVIGGAINLPPGLPGAGWLGSYLPLFALGTGGGAGSPIWILALVDVLVCLAGLASAYAMYGPPDLLGGRQPVGRPPWLRAALAAGFGLDRLYQLAVVLPYRWMAGFLWQKADVGLVDNLLLLPGRIVTSGGQLLRLWSTGRLTTALGSFLLGVTVLLCLLISKFYGVW
jgi:NADH-quinone oxidoreductase subunit L